MWHIFCYVERTTGPHTICNNYFIFIEIHKSKTILSLHLLKKQKQKQIKPQVWKHYPICVICKYYLFFVLYALSAMETPIKLVCKVLTLTEKEMKPQVLKH